jgi:hypothetical protein
VQRRSRLGSFQKSQVYGFSQRHTDILPPDG